MTCTILCLIVLYAFTSLPTILCTKQGKWNSQQNKNSNGDFNFGQEIGVFEGSGGSVFNKRVDGNTIDDDEDFDTFDFSGADQDEGSAIEAITQPPLQSERPCLQRLREATSLGSSNSKGFGGVAGSSAFIPRCTYTGDYAPRQCHGDECWCADKDGNQIIGTIRRNPLMPDCSYIDHNSAGVVVRASTVRSAPLPQFTPSSPAPAPNFIHDQHPTRQLPTFYPSEKNHIFDSNHKNNHHGYHDDDPTSQKMARAFIDQPGILAAIIAGAVIGLLSAVLLVMFIIYHLRHSTRDNYDEKANKIPIIGYTNAHDRDLYA